jgi:hypothetical protein
MGNKSKKENYNRIFICVVIFIVVFLFVLYNISNTKNKCDGKTIFNGVCYNDMKTCIANCSSFVPSNVKDKNFCYKMDDVAVCYPSHW